MQNRTDKQRYTRKPYPCKYEIYGRGCGRHQLQLTQALFDSVRLASAFSKDDAKDRNRTVFLLPSSHHTPFISPHVFDQAAAAAIAD